MRRPLRALLLVLGLATLAGLFSIDGEFVYDDPRALHQNPVVNGELSALAAFDHDFWGAPLAGKLRSYRPLMPLLWHATWSVFPGQPLPFRVLSLVLHVLTTAAVFWLLTWSLPIPSAAVIGAVVFAVHPVHAEAIGGIVSQADVLSAGLGCLALGIGLSTSRRAWLCALMLLLACAAKESAIVFGAAVLLKGLADGKRAGAALRMSHAWPSVLVMLAVIGLQLSLERTGGVVLPDSLARSLDGPMRVLYGLHAIGKGTSLVLVPHGLTPHRGYAAVQASFDSLLGFGLVGLVALIGAITWLRSAWQRSDGNALAMIALWMGPLLIQSGFLVTPMTDVVDRLLYTPSICASYVLALVLAKERARRLARFLLPLVVIVFALLSLEAQRAWTSNLALWERAVMIEPRSWQARKNVAAYLTQANRAPHAAWHFLLAVHMVRQYPRPIDFTPILQLQVRSLGERLDYGPFVLEPDRPCDLVRVYLTNMRKSAPNIVNQLAPRYAKKGCVISP